MAGLGALGAGGLLAGKSLAVLGAGFLAGAIGGAALVGSGAVHVGPPPGGVNTGGGVGLELVPCPDQGPVIGTIPPNQQVLVTAKSADEGWLQLYWPAPGIERAWTKAGPLELEGDLASLPVARCEAPPTATPRATVEPTPTPEPTPEPTPIPSPTPTPTPTPTAKPTPTPTAKPTFAPTPTPASIPTPNTAPRISGLGASRTTISYDQGTYCVTAPKSTTISVSVTDADGIAGVSVFFKRPGTKVYVQKPMQLSNGRYVATLDTTADNIKNAGKLLYYVVAKDANARPKTSRSPTKGALTLTVRVCANTGPKITRYASDVASLETNPLGTGTCQLGYALGTGIEAEATDVDGVASITLFFRGPGMAKTISRAMNRDGEPWFSFINAKDDGITGTGTMSWYVVAKDTKGASTRSKTKSIKVFRCDTDATRFGASANPSQLSFSFNGTCAPAPPADIAVTFGFLDFDGPSPTGVTIEWTVPGAASRAAPATRTSLSGSSATYAASIPTAEWATLWKPSTRGNLSVVITSVDVFGGRTTSAPINVGFYYRCQP